MPRPLRVHLEGVPYYVTCEGSPAHPLFQDTTDYQTYLDLVAHYRAQYGFQCLGLTLLPNQVHLCLELPQGATVSSVMHDLNSRYTKYHAKRYSTTGHLFQGRFRAALVEPGPYLFGVLRRMQLLPQETGIAADPQVYTWSSFSQPLPAGSDGTASLESEELVQGLRRGVIGSPAFIERVQQAQRKTGSPSVASLQETEAGPTKEGASSSDRSHVLAFVIGGALILGTGLLGGLLVAGRQVSPVLKGPVAAAGNSEQQTLQKPVAAAVRSPSGVSEPTAQLAMATPPLNLSGTEWDIHLVPMYAKGNPPAQEDHLRFEGGRVSSKALESQGFGPSNFTLTVQPDKTLRWETMQTHPNGETVFWRGEWDGQEMRGIVSRHPVQGVPQDFVFRAIARTHDQGRML